MIRSSRRAGIGALALLLAAAGIVPLSSPAVAVALETKSETFVAGASGIWTVPAGVTTLEVEAVGGSGGSRLDAAGNMIMQGGKAARVTATMNVVPGQLLYVNVATNGADTRTGSFAAVPAGVNGGVVGQGGTYASSGGASDIRKGGNALADRILVAGGGGAQGGDAGSPGPLSTSTPQWGCVPTAAGAGTQTTGGAGATATGCRDGETIPSGSAGTLGQGGAGAPQHRLGINQWSASPGGGGGYYGGGGGAHSGGGGGSSYVSPTLTDGTVALAEYNRVPYVKFTYVTPIQDISIVEVTGAPADGVSKARVEFTLSGLEGLTDDYPPIASTSRNPQPGPPTRLSTGRYFVEVIAPTAPTIVTVEIFAGSRKKEVSVTFTKRVQTVTVDLLPPTTVKALSTFAVPSATASSGLAVATTVAGHCTLDSGVVTAGSPGTCTFTFSQAGNELWASASATKTVTVVKIPQSPGLVDPIAVRFVGDTAELAVTGGGSSAPIAVTASGPGCTVAERILSLVAAGECTVTVAQDGDLNHEPGNESYSFTVSRVAQSITFAPPTSALVGESVELRATGGGSSAPVTFEASGVCELDGSRVRFTGAGTCTVSASQDADHKYLAAETVSGVITVSRVAQSITFAPPTSALVGESVELRATGGGSSAPVTFEASGVCELDGSRVRFTGAGTCTVSASQDADHKYLAAETVPVVIKVARVATSVTLDVAESTHGSAVVARAVVGDGVPGTVQFTVDGVAAGTETVVDGAAVLRFATLPAGAHAVAAKFVPSDEVTYTPSSSLAVKAVVAQAPSTLAIGVAPDTLTATARGTGLPGEVPTGAVTFTVDGVEVGTAALTGGVARLTHTVSAQQRRNVAATYAGDRNYLPASASTVRETPTIVATLSARPNAKGWHSQPVMVTFTCASGSAPLAEACPGPVTVADGAAQTVTRSVTSTDGGVATASIAGINVDTTAPRVSLRGIKAGASYTSAPKVTCKAVDGGSGIASCKVSTRVEGDRIIAKAVALNQAGVKRTTTTRARLSAVQVLGAQKRQGAAVVKAGARHTLVVRATKRPTYLAAVQAPRTPHQRVRALRKVGPQRWAIALTFEPAMKHTRKWNVGVVIDGKTVVLPVFVKP